MKKLYKYLKLLSIIFISPALLALGPCDNGALPGDPQDPGESSTSTSATPTPEATPTTEPTPSPTPSAVAEVTVTRVKFVNSSGQEVTEVNVSKSAALKLSVKVSLSDGTTQTISSTYDGSNITWKTSSPSVLQLLNNQGNFKALSSGISFVIAKHAKFTITIKVTVTP